MVTLTTKQVSEIQLALRLHRESVERLKRMNIGNKNHDWYESDTTFIASIESTLAEFVLEVFASPDLKASLEVKL